MTMEKRSLTEVRKEQQQVFANIEILAYDLKENAAEIARCAGHKLGLWYDDESYIKAHNIACDLKKQYAQLTILEMEENNLKQEIKELYEIALENGTIMEDCRQALENCYTQSLRDVINEKMYDAEIELYNATIKINHLTGDERINLDGLLDD